MLYKLTDIKVSLDLQYTTLASTQCFRQSPNFYFFFLFTLMYECKTSLNMCVDTHVSGTWHFLIMYDTYNEDIIQVTWSSCISNVFIYY